ncbi:helix-turn-helix domain-containing protein [Desulfopila inferna]|uniref:helix-turn-helix domain-containing protein n=1 Tax=Desulfopila inferna TaxID=468528 RepID=UPI001962D308|nr:helix-turn-helix domain-containing protein [Desulfopila inferna]MBM9605264.1 helix-turn-helix domain-containing protein [Desulfopila inferna]
MNISNPDLELAEEYIHDTGSNIFLTGKAGTGKTTFLHTLKQNCPKRLVITAPTGVAAINAGGVTLHSFFQLPFGPFLPGSQNSRNHFRFSKEKQGIIKSLDLLVIDEISMVRADLLDGVDNVLRRLRRSSLPFGGVQLLMIGDLHQLPPVVKNEEWRLLRNHYASAFFFGSNALASTEMVTIELKKIYRQQDSSFIDILNQVRNNSLDASSLAALNSRVIADFSAEDESGCITLCTHNRSADVINRTKLEELPGKPRTFAAEIEGEFPDHTYPAAEALTLKKGAQVMFIRNDLSADKRYFNGKIGIITSVSPSTIRVKCPDDHEEIEVEPATWENIEYSLNKETQEITEKIIGTFNQHPLRLAWAITIHKSQGLTFDKAMIDAQAAFAHGQVYVALSRCRTLEGMVLSTPLSAKVMNIDQAVLRFADEARSNPPTPADLRTAKTKYQQRLILECFDFGRLRSLLRRMVSLILGNRGSVQVSGISDIAELLQVSEEAVFTIGGNFQRQLRTLFNESVLPAEDHIIHERLTKASAYFQEKITLLGTPVSSLQVDTDSKELRKKIRNTLQLLEEEIGVKLAAVSCCKDGFDATRYFRAISSAALDTLKKPAKKEKSAVPAYTESDISHPELFQILKEWRSSKAAEEGVANFQVLHQKTLIQIAVKLPESLPALKKIKGIGAKLAEKYGGELVEMVGRYRSEHNIEEVELPRLLQVEKSSTPEKRVVDTRKLTLELFENGLTPLLIAEQRELTLATIESHIAHLIEEGEIAASALISAERLEELQDRIAAMSEKPLKEIKRKLTVEATYGEIRFVQAHLRHLASSSA